MSHRQTGFTLVELMVAMVIGTVIILGAGQLFLTTFQTFQSVDKVSRKQEALIFAVNTLTDAGRKGNIDGYAIVADERGANGSARHYCVLQDRLKSQPVVDLAQVDDETDCPTLSQSNDDNVSHIVTLLVGDCRKTVSTTCDTITFMVTERNKVITPPEAAQ